jgi:predicted RNA-binding protein with PUA domain
MTTLTLARQLLDSTRRHLQIRVDVAAALLERAETHPSPVARAEAQIAAAEALIAASNTEFELTGQRSALPSSLDNPLRHTYHAVGNYHLNGVH